MEPKDKGLFVLLLFALSATSAGMIVNVWPY
ncbi:hypothetical protein D0Z66_02755 [Cereibacter sphaeroides]|uniref:Uncharacterized protein n=1 Tax=Cereibacter azotoformans TaxID=43057 RepID=A0A2T5K748_9RHOB|nr:hypothetical protein D0Z66_02755 [Cereibacter sphaeroides]PTR18178.1 hypothetical protein C8J28_109136 [Cereibacter azotoformans]